MEDPGGVPLDRLLGQPLNIAFSLRLAIGLSRAIGHLHQRGIIHKDIKPAHVLVNSDTGQCWLRGFGIASRLPRERQAPESPEFIAGTLAYMAPEQTGRMNRSIDSRSDLYSLGVTLYQMVTGSLPFTAMDPMEWVHCHIARLPEVPAQRVGNIPKAVSAIIMKLLAKTAEERYQTAAGVENDLRRCLMEWETRGCIDDFVLVGLAGLSGLDLQKRILEANREIPIVFITGHEDVPTSVRAMKAGAVEFLVKPFSEEDLLDAIEQAIKRDQSARYQQAQMEDLWNRYESLTPRQRQVMEKVASGLLNKQVAAELGLSEITVKVQRGQVMHKMGAGSFADLVRMQDKLRIWSRRRRSF
jgi:FixJ family two-component response regulator